MARKAGVLIAMSGGVDSSVAAGLLQRAGYECTGVFMCLGQVSNAGGQGCCSPEDAADAKRVAARLGIDFQVLDFKAEIEEIIDYFVKEYHRGRTPNPCVLCNSRLKFGRLFEYAELIGAEYVATGHYARIVTGDGQKRLCRAVDSKKDQSYALFSMARERLEKVLLPVGDYPKAQVRELAGEMNLPVRDKAESQEICFVPDNDYARLVAERAPELCQRGPVVDTAGKVLGEHEGVFHYTIGQRRGLGIALGEPAYVVELDAASNTVVLGSGEELLRRRLYASEVNWLVAPAPREEFAGAVQIRYNHQPVAARVKPVLEESGTVREVIVDFDEAVSAVTPGQAAVFYDGEVVVGGGWIDRSEK